MTLECRLIIRNENIDCVSTNSRGLTNHDTEMIFDEVPPPSPELSVISGNNEERRKHRRQKAIFDETEYNFRHWVSSLKCPDAG